MSRTLLSVVQTVVQELGIPAPASCTGSSDRQTIQLVALANEVGVELTKEYDWPFLKYAYTLLTSGGVSLYDVTYTYLGVTITADRIIPDTGWDLLNHWPVRGALTDQQFDAIAYGAPVTTTNTGTRYVFRMAESLATGVRVQIYPTPSVTQATQAQLSLDFITNMWAIRSVASNSPTGTLVPYGTAMLLDTDTHPFDELLFKYALKWKFLSAKGLAFDAVYDQYTKRLALCKSTSGPGRTLSLSRGRRFTRLVDYSNVPETGFGGV